MSDERHMNDSTMPLPKRKPSTGNPRVKRGFGLADWTRLVRSSKDLAQRKGEEIRRNISREEVAKHDKEYDGWVIVHGKVYNIGPYLHYHPGGLAILKPCLGKDATGLFEKYHRWVNVEGLIGSLLMGYIEQKPHTLDDTQSYLPSNLVSNDGFAVPAPRQPQKVAALPNLLKQEEDNDDDKDPLDD